MTLRKYIRKILHESWKSGAESDSIYRSAAILSSEIEKALAKTNVKQAKIASNWRDTSRGGTGFEVSSWPDVIEYVMDEFQRDGNSRLREILKKL